MTRLISIQEAALLLECSENTVRNWIKKGVLATHTVNKHLVIDKKTIEENFDSLQQLESTSIHIQKLKEQLTIEENALNKQLKDIHDTLPIVKEGMPIWMTNRVYDAILRVAGDSVLNQREFIILSQLNNGDTISDLKDQFGLTRERIRQIVERAFRKIHTMQSFSSLREENKSLKKEIFDLKKQVEVLSSSLDETEQKVKELKQEEETYTEKVKEAIGRYGSVRKIREMKEILDIKLTDIPLTVRSLRSLRSLDIYTIGDLVKHCKTDLLKIRTFGKKSLSEVSDLVESYGLSFGMDSDEIYKLDTFISCYHEQSSEDYGEESTD